METKVANFSRTLHLCSIDHDEVCFEGPECPVCNVKDKLSRKTADLEELRLRIERIERNLGLNV